MTDEPASDIARLDEMLELLYWLEGEKLANGSTLAAIARFLAQSEESAFETLVRLVERGDVSLWNSAYHLTPVGRREGARRFAEDFHPCSPRATASATTLTASAVPKAPPRAETRLGELRLGRRGRHDVEVFQELAQAETVELLLGGQPVAVQEVAPRRVLEAVPESVTVLVDADGPELGRDERLHGEHHRDMRPPQKVRLFDDNSMLGLGEDDSGRVLDTLGEGEARAWLERSEERCIGLDPCLPGVHIDQNAAIHEAEHEPTGADRVARQRHQDCHPEHKRCPTSWRRQ